MSVPSEFQEFNEVCNQKTLELKSKYANLLKSFNDVANSWLTIRVGLKPFTTKRVGTAQSPLGLFYPNWQETTTWMDRLVFQVDGFTQLDFQLFYDGKLKVLSNVCLSKHEDGIGIRDEEKAFAHKGFEIGKTISIESFRDCYLAYIELSNLRVKSRGIYHFNPETKQIYQKLKATYRVEHEVEVIVDRNENFMSVLNDPHKIAKLIPQGQVVEDSYELLLAKQENGDICYCRNF